MPRQARVVIPGLPHHVTQRGNNQQDVFFVDGDRIAYLEILRRQCEKYGATVLGYCLMTNHVHLVLVPKQEESLNLAVGRTHFIYTQHINRLHGRSGHLWQGRFHSCPMDDEYALKAMRYVERNPVRARMTRVPWTYRWSSARTHTGGPDPSLALDLAAWNELVAGMNWREALTGADDRPALAALRLNTQTGRPLASDSFLSKLEHKLGRRLRALPVGRPKKASNPSRTTRK
ncbi:MAG: transposase [Candidatus Hydrogenedentes bacterium]|nr:transposase [Candidatus Hydrogenedentota bacterium]